MGLSRWNGTSYEAVKPTRYKMDGWAEVEPKHAYIWQSGAWREVWSASQYPVLGQWGPTNIGSYPATNVGSWTAPATGVYALAHTVQGANGDVWNGIVRGALEKQISYQSATSPVNQIETLLYAGDVIQFQAIAEGSSVPRSGNWSVDARPWERHVSSAGSSTPTQPAQNAWTTLATWTAPRDMVVDLSVTANWRGAYAAQRLAIRIGSWWSANVAPGTAAMTASTRAFVPAGTVVLFEVHNNTATTYRWIDSFSVTRSEVANMETGPQTSGPLVRDTLTTSSQATALMTWRAPKAMDATVSMSGVTWANGATSTGNRYLYIYRNQVLVGAASADEATSISRAVTLNKGDEVSFRAMSSSTTTNNREITGGNWAVVAT